MNDGARVKGLFQEPKVNCPPNYGFDVASYSAAHQQLRFQPSLRNSIGRFCGAKTAFVEPIYEEPDDVTKTGSGQTWEMLREKLFPAG